MQFDLILPKIKAASFGKLHQVVCPEFSKMLSYPAHDLGERLHDKENNLSSHIGDGVSMLDLQIPLLQNRGRFKALVTLCQPIAANTPDKKNIDIVCFVLSPESDVAYHLHSVSRITRLFKQNIFLQKLREARDEDTIRSLLIDPEGWLMAA